MSKTDYGLGRKFAPDPRDANFPLRAAISKEAAELPPRPHRYHLGKVWLNQGNTNSCTGHSVVHWAQSSPVVYKVPPQGLDPFHIYREALKIDEWEGEADEGTSVRAAIKVAQREGFVESYHWGRNAEDCLRALEEYPVILGIPWYTGMFEPNSLGVIKPTGIIEGGHAILADGYTRNEKRTSWRTRVRQIRLHNSWGREWGLSGYAYISIDDLDLLLEQWGEVCLAKEKKYIKPV